MKMAGKGIVVNVAAGESKLIRGAQTAVLKPGEMVSIGRPLGGLLRYFTSSLWDDIKQNVAGNDAKKKLAAINSFLNTNIPEKPPWFYRFLQGRAARLAAGGRVLRHLPCETWNEWCRGNPTTVTSRVHVVLQHNGTEVRVLVTGGYIHHADRDTNTKVEEGNSFSIPLKDLLKHNLRLPHRVRVYFGLHPCFRTRS